MIHLTETGYNAGRLFCSANRYNAAADGDTFQHGVYAPLNDVAFREKCCSECLTTWALEAYDDGDEMPQWVIDIRTSLTK